jgi:hypothetical protein
MARGFAENPQFINRAGRPRKGRSLTDLLEKELAKKRETGRTGKADLVKTLIDMAIVDKDMTALRYLWDRIDGKPVEKIEQTTNAVTDEARAALIAIFGNKENPSGAGPLREEENK